MPTPCSLVIGRIYCELIFEDERLKYPIIHTYEYLGMSKRRPERHEFRCIGSSDICFVTEDELESISTIEELTILLRNWSNDNPELSS